MFREIDAKDVAEFYERRRGMSLRKGLSSGKAARDG